MNYNTQNTSFRQEKPHNSHSPRSPKKDIFCSKLHYTIDNSAVKWELSQACLNSAERKQSQCKALNDNYNVNVNDNDNGNYFDSSNFLARCSMLSFPSS